MFLLAVIAEELGFVGVAAVIGLFGIGEILLTMEEGLSFKGKAAGINPKVVWQTWLELPRYWMTSLRSCVIGCWMGITPAGATPASFMSYGIAKRASKDGDKFGTGEIEGVVAPETAAHAAGTSALLPMLALGVPTFWLGILLILLFPPFDAYSIANTAVAIFAGFEFYPRHTTNMVINFSLLYLEIMVVLINAGIALLLLRDKKVVVSRRRISMQNATLIFVAINLVVDLLYVVVDPRLRVGREH